MNQKLTLIFVFLLGNCFMNAQNITQSEIVGRPTTNSITIQAFFDTAVEVSIQYGTL